MCSTFTELGKEKVTDSDINTTILAQKTFDKILEGIQLSNLNFQLQVSPFSAEISLKKSLVKDRHGVIRLPPLSEDQEYEISMLKDENQNLKKTLETFHHNYEQVVNEFSEAKNMIKILEASVNKLNKPIKNESNQDIIENLKHELFDLTIENKSLREKIEIKEEEINDLENNIKVKVKLSEKLNKELNETKIRAERDKAATSKTHKAEVKSLKKDLGEERKKTIKVEKKLENIQNDRLARSEKLESSIQPGPGREVLSSSSSRLLHQTSRSICAQEIINYKPKYFLGEAFNPACNDCDDSFEGDNSGPSHDGCKHTPQCILRQPFAPPTLSSMPASMVSHWIPETSSTITLSQNPSSIPTLITHCVKLPNPGPCQ